MPLSISEIQEPIAAEMKAFEPKFREFMKSEVPLLDQIMNYIVRRKGKQLRPMLVFLSAGASGKITESTYRGASMIELLHTATLVHDDVVDDANYRRSFFSINALWKNKIAVLVGDYLFAKGLLLSVNHSEHTILKLVSTAVRELAEGELLQMEKARKLDISEEVYYEIIKRKTASLIAACCAVGASSSGADEDMVRLFHEFGENVGIAFQIKDDLFDYGDLDVGKPLGIDIKERKMTLPLIFALNQSDRSTKRNIIGIIKNESHKPAKVAEVIAFVKEKGGILYAQDEMQRYVEKAMSILDKTQLSPPHKEALQKLVLYTVKRNK
ncbi:polyprenyl synthetase family protein [Ravibacter arvi]|uniref:Polyprenyl synthetase family protein n=1 Tax=Ravibacter arvi TaxID=2051041 RepID=A0ABP8LU85_9BACT